MMSSAVLNSHDALQRRRPSWGISGILGKIRHHTFCCCPAQRVKSPEWIVIARTVPLSDKADRIRAPLLITCASVPPYERASSCALPRHRRQSPTKETNMTQTQLDEIKELNDQLLAM
jgi:hypothetical protein